MTRETVYSVNNLTPMGGTFDMLPTSSTLPSSGGGFGGGFNFGSLIGSGGDPAAAVTMGLDAATGGLFTPVTGVFTSITGIDIGAQIQNVAKYGLSSWGASSSPEQAKASYETEIVAYIESTLSNLSIDNIEKKLNEANKFLLWVLAIQNHKLVNHTRAKSTRLGREFVIQAVGELKASVVDPLIQQLESVGAIKELRPISLNDSQIHYTYISPNGLDKDGPFQFDYMVVDTVLLRNIEQRTNEAGNDNDSKELSQSNSSNISEASSGGFLTIAGILFAAYRFLK